MMISSLTKTQRNLMYSMVTDAQKMFYVKRSAQSVEDNSHPATVASLVSRGLITKCTDRLGKPAYALTGMGKMALSAMRYFEHRRQERAKV